MLALCLLVSFCPADALAEEVQELELYNGLLEVNLPEGFEELLKTVGYLDKHQLYYTSKYKVSNILFCPIEEDTPILDPGLLGVIPDTVSDIAYSLHISGLKRHSPTDNDWEGLKSKMMDG